MPVAAGALAAGLATVGANLGSTVYTTERNIANNNAQNQLSREWSTAEAAKAREFELMMSNTAYQRQVADMKAAGLNPAAIGASGGASTPNANAPGASLASANAGHALGIDLLSSAVSMAIAKNKNVSNELIEQMKVASAREVQSMRQAGIANLEAQKREHQFDVEKVKHGYKSLQNIQKSRMWREDHEFMEKVKHYWKKH